MHRLMRQCGGVALHWWRTSYTQRTSITSIATCSSSFVSAWTPRTDVSHVILVDASELTEWAVEHARAVLGPTLAHRVLVMPHRRTGKPPPRKAQLSNVTVMMAAASGVLQPPTLAPKYTCFDATVEKLVTDPVDRDDLSWLRRRAYLHCGLDEFQRPDVLLLILRGDVSLGDRATTARQVENAAELKRRYLCSWCRPSFYDHVVWRHIFASGWRSLLAHASSLACMGKRSPMASSCRTMGSSSSYFGGRTPIGALTTSASASSWGRRPYVAAALAESTCEMMRWKHAPSCWCGHDHGDRRLASALAASPR